MSTPTGDLAHVYRCLYVDTPVLGRPGGLSVHARAGCACPMGTVSYVDEGHGDPILFVHGTPTWSFEYRHLIAGLRPTHR